MNWSDLERWVEDFQNGKDDGSRVIVALEPLLKKTVSAGRAYGWDSYDDALQMARIFLWDAMRDYNPAFGMSFKNFAMKRVKDRLKHKQTASEKLNGELQYWDDIKNNEDVHPAKKDPEIELKELVDALKTTLTKMEYDCVMGRMDGLSEDEIALKFGLTKVQVHKALDRVRFKLRNKVLD